MGKLDITPYVNYNPATNKSTCLHPHCGKEMCGRRPANIRRHYKLIHGALLEEAPNEEEDDVETDPEASQFIVSEISVESDVIPTDSEATIIKSEEELKPLLSITEVKSDMSTSSITPNASLTTTTITPSAPLIFTTMPVSATSATPTPPPAKIRKTNVPVPTAVFQIKPCRPINAFQIYNNIKDKVGFIGCDNMAYTIGSGLIAKGVINANHFLVAGTNMSNLTQWSELGVKITHDNYEVLKKSDIIFICVKPDVLSSGLAAELRAKHEPTTKDSEKIFVSVLTGVSIKTLEESFNFVVGLKMIRAMPNTPMEVGEGCTMYTGGTYVKKPDLDKVGAILNTLGLAEQVSESMIDAASGITSCGPAYVYTFIDALADGAVKNGVPRHLALKFAAQTVFGAAKMVLTTKKHPGALKDEVCSPGGSAIFGLHELERANFRSAVINAVEKSSKRSFELGK